MISTVPCRRLLRISISARTGFSLRRRVQPLCCGAAHESSTQGKVPSVNPESLAPWWAAQDGEMGTSPNELVGSPNITSIHQDTAAGGLLGPKFRWSEGLRHSSHHCCCYSLAFSWASSADKPRKGGYGMGSKPLAASQAWGSTPANPGRDNTVRASTSRAVSRPPPQHLRLNLGNPHAFDHIKSPAGFSPHP